MLFEAVSRSVAVDLQPRGAALTGLLEQDPVTALFYAAYGLNDLLGAAVFATAMTKAYGEQKVD
jgi:hypothetical protein|eukprot:COSAG02_NODE_701_length_18335_cov_18.672955_20_plen_64_part_00